MINKKAKIALKIYGFIGKFLCALAGGILGFAIDGSISAIIGILLGAIGGHLLEKITLYSTR
jgi:hypothetical protein